KLAQQILSDQRIVFQQGAEYADDYRSPWVLRTIYDDIVRNHQYQKTDLIAYLPPSPGLELIDAAQKSYESQYDLLRYYRVLARCA
ncbi:type I restriction endonuclease, partial [Escherichia coli]|nr:type I restriction endonuclease [Escherichia coli]